MNSTRAKPRIEIVLYQDNRHIELLNEYQIDSTIRNTACIPYLENLHQVLCIIRHSVTNPVPFRELAGPHSLNTQTSPEL
jgi:hypothetical protein